MVQGKELRIGNKVYDCDNEVSTITEIRDEFYFNELSQGRYYKTSNPIPLTPDILLKCGFKRNRGGEMAIEINDIASHLELMQGSMSDNYYYPSLTQTPQGDEERTVYFNRINSLHQLQNLYYSLTNQELNVGL